MESVIATISQFGTRQTRAGEVFTLTADGIEYSTFRREIWAAAAPFAQRMAKINFSVSQKGTAQYRNLESVEAVDGAPVSPAITDPYPAANPLPDPPITPDYARPKHPTDRRDIARAVALDKAILFVPHLEAPPKTPSEILTMAEYFEEWLIRG